MPEWGEQFYDIYTGKKFGKWVMLKTLKPKYKDDPRFRAMIEKEFDVRYNLAHPGIVMINDFEDVPGVGMSIITDDVYGLSLRKLLDKGEVTEKHIEKLCTQMVEAMDYIQNNHIVHFPLRPETVIFTENIENLKLIDVGFDQRDTLTAAEATDDILSFGRILSEALDAVPDAPAYLRRIADKCCQPDPKDRLCFHSSAADGSRTSFKQQILYLHHHISACHDRYSSLGKLIESAKSGCHGPRGECRTWPFYRYLCQLK